uniref:Ig-like domain-containing protein n=1 Tax=Esox lucius TaxID=8010 RepID=A0A6Q2YID7_ESOLU
MINFHWKFDFIESPPFQTPFLSQLFEYESVSLSCEVHGGSTGWRVVRNSASGNLSRCGDGWGRFNGTNCIISSTKTADSGVYWCQSESGEQSNTVNITVTDVPVILESPICPVTEGHSVNLNCRYHKTPSDLTADFYKDGSFIRTEITGEMNIPAVSQSDQGLYSCRHPELGRSPGRWMTVTGQSPGSLIVRPNRSQFFEYESVSLSCEVQGGSTGRRVERNPTSGKLTECGDGWGRFDGTNCIISSTKSTDSGVYWCGSGKHKNTVNITVTDGHVILESPALPVTEGFNVTLKCRNKTNPSDLTADFYKNGTFIRTETTGEMTIPAVSQSDEGLYSCRHSELGRSPESWMTVTGENMN